MMSGSGGAWGRMEEREGRENGEKQKEEREGRQERGVKGEGRGWEWREGRVGSNCKLLYEYSIDNFIHSVYNC